MRRSRLHRRYGKAKRNPGSAPRSNPPLFTDLVEFVGPGFAGFAVSRFATRVVSTQISQRAPSWGKHAGAVAAAGTFLASWFLGHKVRWIEKYHTPITVGAAIAAIQSLIQIYLPSLGWVVSDATPDLASAATTAAQAITASPAANMNLLPTNEDPTEFTYNDSFDAGRYSHQANGRGDAATAGATAGPGGPASSAPDLSDLAIDDAIGQSGHLGVFQN